MKTLFTITALLIILLSCNKETKEADYIIAVSGSDYSDNLRIIHRFGTGPYNPLSLSGGEATVSATRKCRLELVCTPHSTGSNPSAPEHQTEGDLLNFIIYQKKKNGNRGDQVAEGSLTVSNFDSDSKTFIEIEW